MRAHCLLEGLPAPECNRDIAANGCWLAEWTCAAAQQLIVEYDGAVHLEDRQRRRDAQRLNHLQEAGLARHRADR